MGMMATGSYYQPPGVGDMQAATEEERRLQELLLSLEGGSRSAAPLQAGKFAVLNLEPLSTALRESRLRDKLDIARKKKSDLQGQYMEEVARRLRQFRQDEEGQTQVTPELDENGDAKLHKLPGNPLAYDKYLTDPYPEVRALATERDKSMEKLREALAKRARFSSMQQDPRNPMTWQEQPKYHFGETGVWDENSGRLVQGTTQVPAPGGQNGEKYNLLPSGAVRAPGGSSTNISFGEKADTNVASHHGIKLIDKGITLKDTFPRQFRALESAGSMVTQGTFDGPLASWKELGAGLLVEFGLAPDSIKDLLARSEQRNSDIGRFVLDAVRALGANPSNADRIYAEQTSGGKKLSAQGQLMVIEAAKADIANSILSHNAQVKEVSQRVPSVADAYVQMPEPQVLGLSSYEFDPQANMYRLRKAPAPGQAAPAPIPTRTSQSALPRGRRAPEGAPGTQPNSGRLEILYQELAQARAAKQQGNPRAAIDEAALLREILTLGGSDPGSAPAPTSTGWENDPAERKRRVEAALKKYGGGR